MANKIHFFFFNYDVIMFVFFKLKNADELIVIFYIPNNFCLINKCGLIYKYKFT